MSVMERGVGNIQDDSHVFGTWLNFRLGYAEAYELCFLLCEYKLLRVEDDTILATDI